LFPQHSFKNNVTHFYRMAMLHTYSKPRTLVSRLTASVAAGLFAFTAATALAQTQPEAVIPSRITQAINPEQRVTLAHNVHPLAQAKYDQGLASGSMQTGRIMLLLQRSAIQEQALRQYLGDLQNPSSANYRKWLTPAQFGQRYGISDTDLTTVTAWLQSQGFTVEKVPAARNVVIFSGNIAQIQQAFHTSIHRYFVNGETHFANSTDPQIPAALAPVVAGVAQLNDFRPKSGAAIKTTAHFDAETQRIKSDLTLSDNSGNQYLFTGPADAATIYNIPNSVLNGNYSAISSLVGGNTYDGTGVTIGIAGDSNINAQDVQLYRASFLPSSYSSNQPNIIIDGNDPGINGDGIEALLDLEVSGGIAPGAAINFYTAADTDLQNGLFLAIYRALNDNAVSILNVSFGLCEAFELTSGNQQILSAWEQAAAQGITVTVSTGDSGSAACDNPNTETVATSGLAVSGLASTPYNVAVGGTDFNVLQTTGTSFSQYVAATNSTQNAASTYYRTALSYIPESPWNDSPAKNNAGYSANTPFKDSKGNTNIVGAGGGTSSCTVATASGNTVTCTANTGYPQPSFQSGISSLSTRAVPDVSLLAADGAYGALWVVCSDNVINGSSTAQTDCQTTNGAFTSSTTFTGLGGTSAAAPAFAGMLALVLQAEVARTGNSSLRLGQANNVLYNLASQSSLYGTVFHDVTTGNNSVVCQSGSPNCGSNGFLTGFDASAGYDAATGLGSVDVAQLIANWKNANFTSSATSLQINGSTSTVVVPHGTQLTFNVNVNPTTATGDVSVVNTSGVANNGSVGFLTLTNGAATGSANNLPGGNYNVYAYYGGSSTFSGSTSNSVAVNIAPESSTTALNINIYDPSTGNAYTGSAASIPYGMFNFAVAQPYGNASTTDASGNVVPDGVPTGNVNFSDGGTSFATAAIASNGAATYSNYQIASQSFSVGSHNVAASYGGDISFNASVSAAIPFTVVQAGTSTAAASSATSVGSTASVTISVAVTANSLGLPPSGTVQLYNGSTAIGSAATLKQGYSSTTGLVQSTASISLTGSQILAVKTAKATPAAFPWGISGGAAAMACVVFFCIPARRRSWRALLALLMFAIIISGATACGSSSNDNNNNNNGGAASITAKYSGDTNYTASTSTAVTITVTQ
jgi:trimeric autotransporter adhesin